MILLGKKDEDDRILGLKSNLLNSNIQFVAGLVFDFASPPNSNNTEAVYNNAKEFMKSSATIQAQYIC